MLSSIDTYLTDEGKKAAFMRILHTIQLISVEELELIIDQLQIRLFNRGN